MRQKRRRIVESYTIHPDEVIVLNAHRNVRSPGGVSEH